MGLKGVLVLGSLALAACSGGLSDSGDARDRAAPTPDPDAGSGDPRDGAAPTLAADAGTGTCGCPKQDIFGVQWSDVACFCAGFKCPDLASLEVPIESCPAESSDIGWGPTLSSGCGRIQYDWESPGGDTRYQFDALTGDIVAAYRVDDIGSTTRDQSCSGGWFGGGTLTDLTACPDFSICLACKTLTPAPADVPACPAP
jgi:hypothetical protein